MSMDSADDTTPGMEQGHRDARRTMEMPRRPSRGGAYHAEQGAGLPREVSLPPDYLRRIARVEAMPENAPGADKTWVHTAHADAVRHLRSAKRR